MPTTQLTLSANSFFLALDEVTRQVQVNHFAYEDTEFFKRIIIRVLPTGIQLSSTNGYSGIIAEVTDTGIDTPYYPLRVKHADGAIFTMKPEDARSIIEVMRNHGLTKIGDRGSLTLTLDGYDEETPLENPVGGDNPDEETRPPATLNITGQSGGLDDGATNPTVTIFDLTEVDRSTIFNVWKTVPNEVPLEGTEIRVPIHNFGGRPTVDLIINTSVDHPSTKAILVAPARFMADKLCLIGVVMPCAPKKEPSPYREMAEQGSGGFDEIYYNNTHDYDTDDVGTMSEANTTTTGTDIPTTEKVED